jgi:uncharacterized protein YukE
LSTPGEILRKVGSIQAANADIRRAKDRCSGTVEHSRVWWIGASGEVMRSKHRDIAMDLQRLCAKLDALQSETRVLASKVSQADEARREEQRRLAALAAAAKSSTAVKR